MKHIHIVTDKPYLGQKIRLALMDKCLVSVGGELCDSFDICLWDIDFSEAAVGKNIITMSYSKPAMLSLPCSFEALYSLIYQAKDSKISLVGRVCYLRGEAIKLTELEAALLSMLIRHQGEFVSREEILSEVWQGEADSGIINVYIHYLREKLERGEKIILSSRKQGYRISENYLGGRDAENN